MVHVFMIRCFAGRGSGECEIDREARTNSSAESRMEA